MGESMKDDEVVKMVQKAEDFPKLSPIAAEIARMTTDLSAPVQKIAEKIQSEEQLVGKMLKIVNSPF